MILRLRRKPSRSREDRRQRIGSGSLVSGHQFADLEATAALLTKSEAPYGSTLLKAVDRFDALIKAYAEVGAVHKWKAGLYRKVSKTPSRWEPVKKVGDKYVHDDSRDDHVEEGPKKSQLKQEDVHFPKKKSARGRPGQYEVRHLKDGSRIVRIGEKNYAYDGDVEHRGKITGAEKKRYDTIHAKEQGKAGKEPAKPAEKKKTGRKGAPLLQIVEQPAYQKKGETEPRMEKFVSGLNAEGKRKRIRYRGDAAVGDTITQEEFNRVLAESAGKGKGRRATKEGTIIERGGKRYLVLGNMGGDKNQSITFYGSGKAGETVDAETLQEYRSIWENKQGQKRARKALFDFAPRKRNFTTQRKGGRRNPFSPPTTNPNRGEVTGEDRNLVNGVYLDSGVQVVKGNSDFITDTNYLSDDLREMLYSHQTDFVNQSLDAFQRRKKKAMLNFDGTGAGKTMQQLALAETYIENNYSAKTAKPIFIVTQSDRIITNAFLPDAKTLKIKTTVPESPDQVDPNGINLITYQSLEKFYDQAKDTDLIIFDEAHKMKGNDTKTSEFGMKLSREIKHAAMFTATPIDKNEHLLYLANAANFDESKLMEMMGYKWRPPKGGQTKGTWNLDRTFTAQEIIDNIARISNITDTIENEGLLVRREKSLSGLTFRKIDVDVEDSAGLEKNYNAAKQIEIAERDIDARVLGGKWIQMQRSVIENLKVPAALDAIEKEIGEGRQVVFFATRANSSLFPVPDGDTVGAQVKELVAPGPPVDVREETDENGNTRIVRYYQQIEGTIPMIEEGLRERGISFESVSSAAQKSDNPEEKVRVSTEAKIDRFQKGEARVFITTPQSGGTGLNLDDSKGDAPRTAIVMTPPFSASDLTQMAGRIHRLSTRSNSRVLMLTSDTEVDKWNTDIIDTKMQRLGAAVSGDVKNYLDPKIAEMIGGMDDDQAAAFLESMKEKGGTELKASSAVKPFNPADFVSAANRMTGRLGGMNDVDVLKEYGMFTDADVAAEQRTDVKWAKPRRTQPKLPNGKPLPLPVDTRTDWVLPVNHQSAVGRILCSRSPEHPEVPRFYVVVGKDEKGKEEKNLFAYAKPVASTVSNDEALEAMVRSRYGRLGKKRVDDFLAGLHQDAGTIRKARRDNALPEYNGAGYIPYPEISSLSEQLLTSLVKQGDAEALSLLYADNKADFMENVW